MPMCEVKLYAFAEYIPSGTNAKWNECYNRIPMNTKNAIISFYRKCSIETGERNCDRNFHNFLGKIL